MPERFNERREDVNWFVRLITLGDRFSLRDFYDRIKRGIVEFLIVFFGVLLSFSVERKGEDFGDRESNIENLHGLRSEIKKIRTYTVEYKESIEFISELYQNQYDRWDAPRDSAFIDMIEDEEGKYYFAPMSLYLNRDPFDPPRVTYDAIKLDGTFRFLGSRVGKTMTDTYDGTFLKYLIVNTEQEEREYVKQFSDRIANRWVYDLPRIDIEDNNFWIQNRKYIQQDRFIKYNLFKRLELWEQIKEQLEEYTQVLDNSTALLDSVIQVKDDEIEIIWWVF